MGELFSLDAIQFGVVGQAVNGSGVISRIQYIFVPEHLASTNNSNFQSLSYRSQGTFGIAAIILTELVWAIVLTLSVAMFIGVFYYRAFLIAVHLAEFLLNESIVHVQINFGVRLHSRNILFSESNNLKFALFYDINMLGAISLGIHCLVSIEFFENERVHKPLNLGFCPMF